MGMDAAEDISGEIELSGALSFVAGAPLVEEKVTELLDTHIEKAARLKVCITSKGGAKRDTLKPTITKVGEATAIEAGDVLQAIAWSHCSMAGVRGRYCVEVYCRDQAGRVERRPHREYFDLSPDMDAPEIEEDSDKPSASYVRELERTNERTLRILQETARSVIRRDEQYHRDRIAAVSAEGQTKVDLARVQVEKVETEARGRRKDMIVGAATSMLPKAIMSALTGDSDAAEEPDPKLPPSKRIEAYLTSEELAAFTKVIGDERWGKMQAASTIKECREILSAFTKEDVAQLMKLGVPQEKLVTIGTWGDEESEAAAPAATEQAPATIGAPEPDEAA